ncbi:MAG: large conductance mechanosensitive channel protein MscL [Acidobacteria bacterium]|nr:MAG: large conductance mechanosensitive channel protein MscL [Acidobacteriota bacterium]
MPKRFRQFMLRGNVVDLAVAVVIGAAFGGVVSSLVKDLLTPLIAAIFGKPDFSAIAFEVNGSKFLVGTFINTVVSFLLIGTTVYFLIVAPMNALTERMRKGEAPADPTTRQCPECLSEIPIAARRCKFCATALTR